MTYWISGDGNWHNRTSKDEFGFGQTRACGPASHEIGMANIYNREPQYKYMSAICARDEKHNPQLYDPNGGQTFEEIIEDFELFDKQVPNYDHLSKHLFEGNGYSLNAVMECMHEPQGQNAFILMQVGSASYVSHNEGYGLKKGQKGFINEHFICIVGYSDVEIKTGKMLVANPDREPHSSAPDWITTTDVMRGIPQAMLVVFANKTATQPVPVPPAPTPLQAMIAELEATIAKYKA